jgi:hypothetical protein
MAITNTWAVQQMDCYPQHEGESNVVFNVHWRCEGVDGDHCGSAYGSQGLMLDPEAPFVPFADLTEAQVIGWVQDAMGEEAVAAIEANIAGQIENAKNPPVVNPALPWAGVE